MKKLSLYILCAGILVTGLWPTSIRSESIWKRRNRTSAFLFVDNRARQVGDLLMVLIEENTGIQNQEQKLLDKATSSTGEFNFGGTTSSPNVSREAAAGLDASNATTRNLQGTASFLANRRFADQITVRVIDVKPNGNIVIAGSRQRIVAGETRTLQVAGQLRPNDIAIDGNYVLSSAIADFRVSYTSAGQEQRFVNHGWFGKFVNRVWPF